MREVRASRGQGWSPSRTGTLDLSRVMLLVYVLAALELACLFMQFSVMPYLSRRLGLDSVAFGYQQTIFGVLQLLGGPVFGRFADQRGARAAFTLSFLASSALYLLLAAACSPALPGVPLLFASRLPGALMHTLPAAQMAITDLSAPEERPAALGRLGLCFGVGVIFGSLLGGTLSSTCGIQCPVIVALVVSLLGAVLSLTCIPTSTKGASAHAQAALPGKPKASVFDLKAITCLLLQPGVLPVFLVKVICGFPSAGGRPGRLPHVLLQGPPDGRQLGVARPVPQGWARPVTGRSPGLTPAPGGAALNPLCPGHFLSAWWRWQGTRSSRAWSSGGLAAASPREPCSGPACWRSAWWDWPWNHAGPLRLCAATDQNPGAHPGRPPVPPLRSPRFRPRAARRQLPHAAGPLEAACAPKDGQSLVTVAPRHRLAINSLRTSSRLISISWAGGLGTRAGWSLGCWRASWRRGPAAVPQGSRESRITQVHPSGRWVLPPESATKASEEYPLLPPRQLCPRRSQRQGAPCSPLHTPHPTPTPGLGSSTCCPHTLLSP
nr:solute carrier family 22 member 18 isoform X8 [Globicephala melas]XP_030689020.1 solute carrier family 22 member 18 isoform X8 [Globicephala melas]XP_030689021.1 solute carrier family 22 member 18 isoform X8 [Globicephala melas]